MKKCGECTICCTTPRIPELNKPERVTCEYCTVHCTIYDTRPGGCRDFQCLWSLTPGWSKELRPDKCGVVIEKFDEFMFAMCDGNEWMELHNEFKVLTDKGIPVVINSLSEGNNMVLPTGMQPDEVINRIKRVFG